MEIKYRYSIGQIIKDDKGIGKVLRQTRSNYGHKQYEIKCCGCGNIYIRTENHIITRDGFKCSKCSSNKSYSEKFVINMLQQLNIEFKTEKTFLWSKNVRNSNPKLNGRKRYDFYIEELNCVVETHGKQHYVEGFKIPRNKTLQEEQENDKLKKRLALENGIKYYITINCMKSELNWIKNNILKSKLSELFDLSKINWLKCEEYANNNLVNEIGNMYASGITSITQLCNIFKCGKTSVVSCLKKATKLGICNYVTRDDAKRENIILASHYWNDNMSIDEISKIMNKHRDTIRSYLKDGNIKGLCVYNSEEEAEKSHINYNFLNANKKEIYCIETNKRYESSTYCSNISEKDFGVYICATSIRNVCSGKQTSAKGFHFKIIDSNVN